MNQYSLARRKKARVGKETDKCPAVGMSEWTAASINEAVALNRRSSRVASHCFSIRAFVPPGDFTFRQLPPFPSSWDVFACSWNFNCWRNPPFFFSWNSVRNAHLSRNSEARTLLEPRCFIRGNDHDRARDTCINTHCLNHNFYSWMTKWFT